MTPIEIRAKRIAYLIPIPFTVLLMVLFYKYAIIDNEQDNTIFFITGIFVVGVGAFLSVYFLAQFFRNPVLFKADDKGFEYIPAGVSLGLVRWEDVSGLEEVEVKVVRGDVPTYEKALAIILKNPDEYRQQFNAPLRKLMEISEQRNKGTILIEPASLQGRYEEVKKYFEEQTKRTRDPWMR